MFACVFIQQGWERLCCQWSGSGHKLSRLGLVIQAHTQVRLTVLQYKLLAGRESSEIEMITTRPYALM